MTVNAPHKNIFAGIHVGGCIQRWKISFEAGWCVFRGPPSNWR